MPDDFCLEHGYEFMRCDKVWGAIPYCLACDVLKDDKEPPDISEHHFRGDALPTAHGHRFSERGSRVGRRSPRC